MVSSVLTACLLPMAVAIAPVAAASEPASFTVRVQRSQDVAAGAERADPATPSTVTSTSAGEPASFIVRVQLGQGIASHAAAVANAVSSEGGELASFTDRVQLSQFGAHAGAGGAGGPAGAADGSGSSREP